MKESHIPVLANEWLSFLPEDSLKIYVDGTLGAGGHALCVLENHPEIERFIGIDQDTNALEIAKEKIIKWSDKVTFVHRNFSEINQVLEELGIEKVDGILLDLGVSSMQLDVGERGFSFQQTGPLDMRMNRENELSAEIIVNTWSEEELGRIFRDYGEEWQWRRAARKLVQERSQRKIVTTKDLVEVLSPVLKSRKVGIHPVTKVFQALRICVNSELEVLQQVLPQAINCLNPRGVLGVITFHSLEDRIVKNFFRHEASNKQDTSGLSGLFLEKPSTVTLLNKKPITATDEEIELNPRSRSAKLRVVEKK
ncbi:MAG: Ribosomal RNA small subunit methyltransferase H [Chlamydiae bacterium]|nr:Ribosomal RNA small subunit methyltransferase H [Chlamydiota bacterium]